MDLDKLKSALQELKQPGYRLSQVAKAVYHHGVDSYESITGLPKPVREALSKKAPMMSVALERVLVSSDKLAHKALLKLSDGKVIETVLMQPKPDNTWSVCISSQVGCAMGCTFCATGLMGLKRNLTSEEIVDQVLFWKQYMRGKRVRGRLSNVVYMGMGEPLHNLKNVFESLRLLTDPERFGLAQRHISVSTVGLLRAIEKFVEAFPQVNLALSLHAANDKLRRRLVPANRGFSLGKIRSSLENAVKRAKRKIFLEYVLLAGDNNRPRDARELADFIRSTSRPDLLHVNLIVWNPTETPHSKPNSFVAGRFRDALKSMGVKVTIRKNLGTDIDGACGQLMTGAAKRKKPPKS